MHHNIESAVFLSNVRSDLRHVSCMVTTVLWIGFAYLIWHLIVPLLMILFHYSIGLALFSKRKQLKRAGQWAIVTGGTDGIGKAFSEELASDGLNIMLISRNSEKLQAVAGELGATYNVSVRCVTTDFTQTDVYENIKKEIDSLPSIACLINNVGMASANLEEFAFADGMCEENIRKFVACNCLSMASMTHIVLPRLVMQNSGAALINLSSYAGHRPLPYISLYAATKAFVRHLSQSLNLEVQGKNVVMQTLIPMYVATSMVSGRRGFFVVSPRSCAKASLDMLGVESLCCGHIRHAFQIWYFSLLPQFLVSNSMENEFLRTGLHASKNK
ncbi:17beta-estradiol 17-dehydrogenase / very-long-chain 3-oxoacyl-CoA reductase [Paragonimus westermani]|uniref:17beta-estradiol 17-dehydrogenase / very-long-chain 3-oxoacyl-CoA reductase n=1 Tax=Paragonimus westermani TaxID=34504 RepID=A0A5J4NK76_9TREM|nr:17beta-estradiol 17-dehydrogenase / very-long-chain 3-oxoacyl-CoA reductase [Paragonimus westermani]